MTVVEALEATVQNLSKVPVKVEDIERVGMPIRSAVMTISECVKVLKDLEQKAEEMRKMEEAKKAEAEDGKNADDKEQAV